MLLAIIIVLNIPVYLAIGWLAFDTASDAADTLWDTVVTILKRIFIPGFVRVLMEDDDDGEWGLFPIFAFLIVCGLIIYGEYVLMAKWFPHWV